MKTQPLLFVAALLVGSDAYTQSDSSARLVPITSPIKQGGTYHAATQSWSRGASASIDLTANQVLYDNTCTFSVLFFQPDNGESFVDSGRLPSKTSPTSAGSLTGTADAYTIHSLDLSYCTSEFQTTSLVLGFYDCYGTVCANQTQNATLAASLSLSNAPASSIGGSLSCWVITIDLRGSTSEFTLSADCDGSYSTGGSEDLFGWELMQQTGGPALGPHGPRIAGDPSGFLGYPNCFYGAGTVWSSHSGSGTGLGTLDAFSTYNPGPSFAPGAAMSGCWWFGGYSANNPYASFFLRLRGIEAPECSGIMPFCNGDGSGTPCPSSNDNDGSNGLAGCANSFDSGGAALGAIGSCSVASDDMSLSGSSIPPWQPGLFFQAIQPVNGGNGNPFGAGLLCANGTILRLEIAFADAAGDMLSTVDLASTGSVLSGQTVYYQLWYRDPAAGGSGFNLTNGLAVTWGP